MSKFSTKGKTLQMLQHYLSSAKILPIYLFTIDDWTKRRSYVLSNIHDTLGAGPWIVRSSCSAEDNLTTSNAGAFASILNVSSEKLAEAIDKVIASYTSKDRAEEILIQPMIENVMIVGVAFSHDPNTGAPDRIINWSEGSDTQAVTAGVAGNVLQVAPLVNENSELGPLRPVITLLEELLSIFGDTPVDFEFALTKDKNCQTLWLLQVRSLILSSNPKNTSEHMEQLTAIKKKVSVGMEPKPFLMGKHNVYGVMPDWNPAEIIGTRPRPLALSLYQELITDSTWAYQRHNYGYRNLRSFPLMLNIAGTPYIDVRVSFNSFIPSDLNEDIAGRLVDYYLKKLTSQPNLHDKVEFEIVLSCYTLDLHDSLSLLECHGFSKTDQACIAESLLKLTNEILHPNRGLWLKDAEKLNTLNSRFQTVKSSKLTSIEKIYWLLEDCKRYGTLPFAGLARAAFIGVQMLRSLVKLNILSTSDYQVFLESVTTVSSQMTSEQKELKKSDFLKKYGHLRPGTYDILLPRYDTKPELYFSWHQSNSKRVNNKKTFSLTRRQMKLIDELLKLNRIDTDAESLLYFIRNTIELREKAKFDFTRNLSEAMSLIEEVGKSNGLSLEDLSFCNVGVFRQLYLSSENIKKSITDSIVRGRSNYTETLGLSLPPLIVRPDDIMCFKWPNADPNYITQKRDVAPITTQIEKNEIANKIVCIPNADPGYDWIFSYPIAGFITAWGGANSHMAIRAGEQDVPAVVGAGEVLYRQWSSSKKLMLNCAEKRVEIIQ